MACDICGKTGTGLEELTGQYQTDDIKQVCSKCEKILKKHQKKLMDMTSKLNQTFMKDFMSILRIRSGK